MSLLNVIAVSTAFASCKGFCCPCNKTSETFAGMFQSATLQNVTPPKQSIITAVSS